jgi:hypothetical protein
MMGTSVQPPLPGLEKDIRDANGRINEGDTAVAFKRSEIIGAD